MDGEVSAATDLSIEDVAYQQPDGSPLLARLYRPAGKGPFPAIVEVHGGAWNSGDRLLNAPIVEVLARSGIFVMSIDFRMPPIAGYPTALADINFAIRWLKSHARRYRLVPEKLGILGTSSGGHMVILGGMRPHDPRYASLPTPAGASVDGAVAFVTACWPILDPLERYHMAKRTGRTPLVQKHDAFWGTEAAMAEGNPCGILERGEPAALPPTLIIQGTADANADHTIVDRFAGLYKQAGGSLTFHKYKDRIHAFIRQDMDGADSQDAIARMRSFIFKHGTP